MSFASVPRATVKVTLTCVPIPAPPGPILNWMRFLDQNPDYVFSAVFNETDTVPITELRNLLESPDGLARYLPFFDSILELDYLISECTSKAAIMATKGCQIAIHTFKTRVEKEKVKFGSQRKRNVMEQFCDTPKTTRTAAVPSGIAATPATANQRKTPSITSTINPWDSISQIGNDLPAPRTTNPAPRAPPVSNTRGAPSSGGSDFWSESSSATLNWGSNSGVQNTPIITSRKVEKLSNKQMLDKILGSEGRTDELLRERSATREEIDDIYEMFDAGTVTLMPGGIVVFNFAFLCKLITDYVNNQKFSSIQIELFVYAKENYTNNTLSDGDLANVKYAFELDNLDVCTDTIFQLYLGRVSVEFSRKFLAELTTMSRGLARSLTIIINNINSYELN